MPRDFITIGRVIRPHGMDGTLKVFPLTDFPERFKLLKEVFLVKGFSRKLSINKLRFHKGCILLTLKGCSDRTTAEEWRNAEVAIDSKDLWPLGEGEYYHFQIEGLKVFSEDGEYLGEVKQIVSTGSNDVYVVGSGEKELLLPAIKEVIRSIDLVKGEMIVHLLEGLID